MQQLHIVFFSFLLNHIDQKLDKLSSSGYIFYVHCFFLSCDLINTSFKIITVSGKTRYYDDIFICCPLDNIETPSKITKNDLESSYVFLILFTSNVKINNTFDRIYINENINEKKNNKILTLKYWGKTINDQHVYSGFGFADKNIKIGALEKIIRNEMGEFKISISKILSLKVHRYDIRFYVPSIQNDLYRKIHKNQGKNGIWYLGGLMSHWDTDNIFEHSKYITTLFEISNCGLVDKIKLYLSLIYNNITSI
jgi:hypothetical protein